MGHLTVPLKHLLLEMDLLLIPPPSVSPGSANLGLPVVETIFRINAYLYMMFPGIYGVTPLSDLAALNLSCQAKINAILID